MAWQGRAGISAFELQHAKQANLEENETLADMIDRTGGPSSGKSPTTSAEELHVNPSIQSLGAPPERHADRVVAAMLRQLAQTRAQLFPLICAAFQNSSDGSPKAQRKLEQRVKQA